MEGGQNSCSHPAVYIVLLRQPHWPQMYLGPRRMSTWSTKPHTDVTVMATAKHPPQRCQSRAATHTYLFQPPQIDQSK